MNKKLIKFACLAIVATMALSSVAFENLEVVEPQAVEAVEAFEDLSIVQVEEQVESQEVPEEIVAPDGTILKLESTELILDVKNPMSRAVYATGKATRYHDITSSKGLWCGYTYDIEYRYQNGSGSQITSHWLSVNPSSSRAVFGNASKSGNT